MWPLTVGHLDSQGLRPHVAPGRGSGWRPYAQGGSLEVVCAQTGEGAGWQAHHWS